jgi:hypothetical protein
MSRNQEKSVRLQTPLDEQRSPNVIIWLVLWLGIAMGIGLRFYRLDAPLVGRHEFRQTQTAFTARYFLRDGISLMHTPLPIFGRTQDVPFEMPLFQACAVGLIKCTGISVDFGCRLTHLMFFLASAGVLYLLGAMLFGHGPAACALLLYVWSPLNVYFSRSALMEFMAVFFALAYALGFVWMMKSPSRGWIFPLVVAAGCIGALVKITTMAIAAPLVACAIILRLAEARTSGGWIADLRRHAWFWIAVVASVVVPLIVAVAWIYYTDRIKASHLLTAYLVSTNLRRWNLGTIHQRLRPFSWWLIVLVIAGFCAPAAISLLFIPAILLLPHREQGRAYLWATMAAAALPILLFFNLYVVHDYYYCAVTPMISLLCGVGLFLLLQRWQRTPLWLAALAGCLLLSLFGSQALARFTAPAVTRRLEGLGWGFAAPTFQDLETQKEKSPDYQVGIAVNQLAPPDQYVIVKDADWNPTILYYAQQRGLMWYLPDGLFERLYTTRDLQDEVRAIGPERFSTIVYITPDPELSSLWKNHSEVRQVGSYHIVRVW